MEKKEKLLLPLKISTVNSILERCVSCEYNESNSNLMNYQYLGNSDISHHHPKRECVTARIAIKSSKLFAAEFLQDPFKVLEIPKPFCHLFIDQTASFIGILHNLMNYQYLGNSDISHHHPKRECVTARIAIKSSKLFAAEFLQDPFKVLEILKPFCHLFIDQAALRDA
ncbi:hypothetical protein BDC45DRAFT_555177 [Circinella umbellata]|nr:hypothetical protein BDC45DRAFT_555177 [Circinella umbellata]